MNSFANTEIAEHSQRFFKTAKDEYGYGDKFLGIRVPVIRQSDRQGRKVMIKHFNRFCSVDFTFSKAGVLPPPAFLLQF